VLSCRTRTTHLLLHLHRLAPFAGLVRVATLVDGRVEVEQVFVWLGDIPLILPTSVWVFGVLLGLRHLLELDRGPEALQLPHTAFDFMLP